MNGRALFPVYIPRDEQERAIEQQVELVRESKTQDSRAVLLYGQGGVGKTRLVRELARRSADDSTIIWLDPIDIDDPEYWLLSNLEQKVAGQLDPGSRYFGSYFEYLSRLPRYTRPRIGHETVVSHLGRIKRVFAECYERFIKETGKTVVLTLDTVEAIRGMYLLLTLTQWIKALRGTLFILSGRPVSGDGGAEDPIRRELDDPHQRLHVETVHLAEFTQAAALDYLEASAVEPGLDEGEMQRLVLLTRGHPLWLAFTVDFLRAVGLPDEAERPLDEIAREVPYQGEMTLEGARMHEAFKRRLVTPYRGTDFWHEAIKRLAVVRRSVNRSIWQHLMSDLALPDELANEDRPWAAAWEELLRTPWIRPRANSRYVTLHDAVAEELALRIIPVHDPDERWRHELWQRAIRIYDELIDGPQAQLTEELNALDEALGNLDVPRAEGEQRPTSELVGDLFDRTARLDARKRELDQLRASRLFYQLLADFETGCGQFLTLLKQATDQHDVLFADLIALEMQRFLPGAVPRQALGDVIGKVIDQFRTWLSSKSPASYLEVGLSMADYLIDDEQPEAAALLLDGLPIERADSDQQFRFRILLGNALIRIPGRVEDGAEQFNQALEGATALRTLGDVFTDDPLQLVQRDTATVRNLPVEEKVGCRDCTWRYWCSGGCAVATFRATGRYDIKSPNCNIYKAIYPRALRLEGLRLLKYAKDAVAGVT
jgi:radical SAM protein with 4Fe4S-binding SPASM domain